MGKFMKKMLAVLIASVMTIGFAFPASAQVTLEDILKRVETLEQENAALKAEVASMKGQQSAQAVELSEVKTKAATFAAAPAVASTGNFIKTKLDMEMYGFVQAVGSYSDSDLAQSNAPVAAPRETSLTNTDQDEFSSSAQDTRLGFKIKGPDLDNGGKTSGQIEIDFANSNTSTYTPRLRLAFVDLDFGKWSINAGQNWDIFAPINPNVINAGALYRQGNLGTRHPQVYLGNKWGEIPGGKLWTKVGIIDTDDMVQEEGGIPVFAGYAGYETKILGIPTSLGLGGLWGEAENNSFNDHSIWAVTSSATMKFTDWLSFKAEGFSGAKLDDFMGGSAIGFTRGSGTSTASTTDVNSKPIRVMGGFMELCYKPLKSIETNYGFGIDSANDDAFIPANDVDEVYDVNKTYYTNIKYSLSKDVVVGLEYQYFKTDFVDGVSGDANRVLSSLTYKF